MKTSLHCRIIGKKTTAYQEIQGVYPQSDGSLVIAGSDASKGFIALWLHLFVAMKGLHRNGY